MRTWTSFAFAVVLLCTVAAMASEVEVNAREGHVVARDVELEMMKRKDNVVRQIGIQTPSLSLSSLPSSTSSAPSSGSTPFLIFSLGTSTTFTTCSSADLTWTFSGPSEGVTFTVTNINVPQLDPPSSSSSSFGGVGTFSDGGVNTFPNDNDGFRKARRTVSGIPTGTGTTTVFSGIPSDGEQPNAPPFLLETLEINLEPASESYTWDKVNVPQGWYRIVATATNPQTSEYENFVERSAAFFVTNGSDTSCLITAGTSPSPSSSGSNGGGSASQTGSDLPTSPSTTPVGASAGGSSVNGGAIAGGVIGGLAAVLLVLAALFFMRRRGGNSTTKTRARASSLGGPGGPASNMATDGYGSNSGSVTRAIGGLLGFTKPGSGTATPTGTAAAANLPPSSSRPGTGASASSGGVGGRRRSMSTSNSFSSKGSGLGGFGLAALGFAPSQKKKHSNPYTTAAKRDRDRRKTHESLGSVGPMLTSSFSSTGHQSHLSQSRTSQSQLYSYGSYGGDDGYDLGTSVTSPFEEKSIPMSPMHSPGGSVDHPSPGPSPSGYHAAYAVGGVVGVAKSPFSDGSSSEGSPSTSRTNSRRSISRVPAPSSASTPGSNSTGAAVLGHSSPSSDSVDKDRSSTRSARVRSQSTPIAPPHRSSQSQVTTPVSPSSPNSPLSSSYSHGHPYSNSQGQGQEQGLPAPPRNRAPSRLSSIQSQTPSQILDVPQTPRTDSLDSTSIGAGSYVVGAYTRGERGQNPFGTPAGSRTPSQRDSQRERYGLRRASSPDYALYGQGYVGVGGIQTPTLPPIPGSNAGSSIREVPSREMVSPPPLSEPTTSGAGGSTSKRKTPRKPVPSYNPDDPVFAQYQLQSQQPSHQHTKSSGSIPGLSSNTHTPSTSISLSHSYSNQGQPRGTGGQITPPNNNSSSSVIGMQKPKFPHTLEHKDSESSLKSLKQMGGDMRGLVGAGTGKQMHVLIPDMPMGQQ